MALSHEIKTEFRQGLKDGIPIALGYFAVSAAFGILAAGIGLSPSIAMLISVTNLTSAGQFAGLTLIGGGSSLLEIGVTVLIINLRYLLMSLSLSQRLAPSVKFYQRFIMAHGITDEIFTVASLKEGAVSFGYMLGLMLLPIGGGSRGTYFWAAGNNILPFFLQDALGIALYGMFIALLIPAIRQSAAILMVVVIAITLSCLFFYCPLFAHLSSGAAIIICTVISAGLGALIFPKEE